MRNPYVMAADITFVENADNVFSQPVTNFKVINTFNSRKSFVWKYFGTLLVTSLQPQQGPSSSLEQEVGFRPVDGNHLYCKLCLEVAVQVATGAMKKFSDCTIQRYSKSVSTGNFITHLRETHNIKEVELVDKRKSKSLKNYFSTNARPVQSSANKFDRKHALARDIAVWFCRDLLPFSEVNSDGFVDFALKYRIVSDRTQLPHRTTISRGALSDVYEAVLAHVKKVISDSPRHGSLTTDMWTDTHNHSSYICFTYHFISRDFNMESLTLRCSGFSGRHTGENIRDQFYDIFEEFALYGKSIAVVSDGGSNIAKACRLANIQQYLCIGHGLHNLIIRDGIKKVETVSEVLLKCNDISKALLYKAEYLDKEIEVEHREALYSLTQVSQQLKNASHLVQEETNEHNYALPSLSSAQPMHRIKKDCSTRWNSILTMLESYMKCRKALERVLEKLGLQHLKLSWTDWSVIEDICGFLENFKKATVVLSASSYCTQNLVLLFYSELKECLKEDPDDRIWLQELKKNMRLNFDKRFPLNNVNIGAALLDPMFTNLKEIGDYLAKNETNRLLLLTNLVSDYVQKEDLEKHATAVKQLISTNADSRSEKKLKFEKLLSHLADKHSFTSNEASENVQKECSLFFGYPATNISALEFWRQHNPDMPHLAALARVLLAIPATSVPSEEIFSVSGLTLTAKRSSLTPNNVNKVVTVHNNYQKCKDYLKCV